MSTDRVVIRVLDPGPSTLVEDVGRPGWAHVGVPPSGALDRPAYELANRLVANLPGLAALECVMGGLSVAVQGSTAFAVTGAAVPVMVNDRPVPWGQPYPVTAGDRISIGAATSGLRAYLAFAGGIDVPEQLGSRSTDLLSGLGPPPLGAGVELSLGPADPERELDLSALDTVSPAPARAEHLVRVWPGPRREWFDPESRRALVEGGYVVTADSNRVAVRLEGPTLHRSRPGELASEGIVTGAVQVPSNGQPLVFLNDHPVTGGYPVVAVVDADDLSALAQARPGDRVRFSAGSAPGRPT